MVSFDTDVQQRIYEKVQTYLRELFGDLAEASEDNPTFWVPHGSTAVLISVLPWEADTTISVRAYVVFEARIDEELMYFLLHQNDGSVFGSFGLDEDDDVFFEHSILGSTCGKEDLRASVVAVMTMADAYDDKIQQRWGGERTAEHVRTKFQ
jgi:hypothetical protein